MKLHVRAAGVLAVLAVACLFVSVGMAQSVYNTRPKTDPSLNPTPRAADGKVDLSGYWVGSVAGISAAAEGERLTTRSQDGSVFFNYGGAQGAGFGQTGPPPPAANQPSYKPEYKAKVDAIAKTMYGGSTNLDPYMDCKPLGVPRAVEERPIMQIAQTPKFLIIAHEAAPGPVFRVVYTDGRQHPKEYDTSFMGHSIGHWDGDTLVVDTVGFNDETWLSDTRGGRDHSTIHSDQMHVIERWTRKGDVITYEATVEDPVMFTKPWVINPERIALGAEGDFIQPTMCMALDKGHLVQETETDKFRCNWCNPETAYSGEAAK